MAKIKRQQLSEEEVEKLKQIEHEDDEPKDDRPDEEVLLQEDITVHTPIGDITLKPWTYGMFYKFADKIEDIFEVLEAKNVNLDAFVDFQTWMTARNVTYEETTPEQIEEFFSKRTLANREMRKLINRIAPHAMPILVHTTGLTQAELEMLPLATVISLGVIIFFQNGPVLGNALGLFDGAISSEEPQEQNG